MTAVDYLIEQLHAPCRGIPSHIIEQAKQMERRQTIDFATDFAKDYIGFDSVSNDPNAATPAEIYYNQIKK